MMVVEPGQLVKIRSGRLVRVDEVASQDPDDYRWYAREPDGSPGKINAGLPVETIFIGTLVRINVLPPHNVVRELGTVVSDFSEVIEIIG